MSDDWYYSTDRRTKVGPVSVGRLRELLRSGQLAATDLVRREGMPKWMSAGKVDELFGPPSSPANPEPQPGGEPVTHAEPDSPGAAPPGRPATPVRGQNSRPHSDHPEPWEDERPQAPSLADKLRANPILLAVSLVFCFPVGLALIWTDTSWPRNRKLAWTGAWAAVMVVLMIVVSLQEAATKKSLDEADRLWGSGQKAEAVAKYKGVIDGGVSSVDQSRRATVFQRVVEFEAEQGNTSAAKQYLQKAETYSVAVASDVPAAKKLLAEMKAEKDAEKHKEVRKTATGDELKGMSLGQITNLLGPPDESYQSRKPPNNMYLYVWKVEGGNYITVGFMRRIDNGEANIITANSDRPRSVVENMRKVLDQN